MEARKLALKEKLLLIENKICLNGRIVTINSEEKETFAKYCNTIAQEEIFWQKESRVTWLKEGGKNTNVF